MAPDTSELTVVANRHDGTFTVITRATDGAGLEATRTFRVEAEYGLAILAGSTLILDTAMAAGLETESIIPPGFTVPQDVVDFARDILGLDLAAGDDGEEVWRV